MKKLLQRVLNFLGYQILKLNDPKEAARELDIYKEIYPVELLATKKLFFNIGGGGRFHIHIGLI